MKNKRLKPWVRHVLMAIGIIATSFALFLILLLGMEKEGTIQEERVDTWEEQFEEVNAEERFANRNN